MLQVKDPSPTITPAGRLVEVFVGVCKKINLRESQRICNLTRFSSQYLCLYQFLFVYIFKEPSLKMSILCEGLSKSLHVFLLKCKKTYWGLSVSPALVWVRCPVDVPSSSGQCGSPFALERSQRPKTPKSSQWVPKFMTRQFSSSDPIACVSQGNYHICGSHIMKMRWGKPSMSNLSRLRSRILWVLKKSPSNLVELSSWKETWE